MIVIRVATGQMRSDSAKDNRIFKRCIKALINGSLMVIIIAGNKYFSIITRRTLFGLD